MSLIVACQQCGQRNRLPNAVDPGKMVVCGSCKKRIDPAGFYDPTTGIHIDYDEDDEDDDE